MRRILWFLIVSLVAMPFEVHLRDAHAQAAPQSALGTWSIFHQPVAATQATISKAAGGTTVKHVATGITVCISAVAAQPDIIFNLRDGATGAGTIVWTARLAEATVGGSKCVVSGPLNIVGSSNTAMTLESAAAPAASNFASVTLSGYDTL